MNNLANLEKPPQTLERKPYSKPALERQGKWSFATGSGTVICFQGCTQNLFFPEWMDRERNKR